MDAQTNATQISHKEQAFDRLPTDIRLDQRERSQLGRKPTGCFNGYLFPRRKAPTPSELSNNLDIAGLQSHLRWFGSSTLLLNQPLKGDTLQRAEKANAAETETVKPSPATAPIDQSKSATTKPFR